MLYMPFPLSSEGDGSIFFSSEARRREPLKKLEMCSLEPE